MKSSIISLLIITFISSQAVSQTFVIDHYEPEGNGFVYDNISIEISFESNTSGSSSNSIKLYAVPRVWDVSYKYNGEIYRADDTPINGTLDNLFKPRYTQFDIVLANGTKLKYSLWPYATTPAYDNLCCEPKYTVQSIHINKDNSNIDARIESKLSVSISNDKTTNQTTSSSSTDDLSTDEDEYYPTTTRSSSNQKTYDDYQRETQRKIDQIDQSADQIQNQISGMINQSFAEAAERRKREAAERDRKYQAKLAEEQLERDELRARRIESNKRSDKKYAILEPLRRSRTYFDEINNENDIGFAASLKESELLQSSDIYVVVVKIAIDESVGYARWNKSYEYWTTNELPSAKIYYSQEFRLPTRDIGKKEYDDVREVIRKHINRNSKLANYNYVFYSAKSGKLTDRINEIKSKYTGNEHMHFSPIELSVSQDEVIKDINSKTEERKFIKEQLVSKIDKQLSFISEIEYGRPYLLKEVNSISNSLKEESYIIFWGNKYIIFTIPDKDYITKLNNLNFKYTTTNRSTNGSCIYDVKLKRYKGASSEELSFNKVEQRIFLGGFGDELLLDVADFNTSIETDFIYSYKTKKGINVYGVNNLGTSFQRENINPIVFTGEVEQKINYKYVSNLKQKEVLEAKKISNAYQEDPLKGIEIIVRRDFPHLVFPYKKTNYIYVETVVGKLKQEKRDFMYFKPAKTTVKYGYQKYTNRTEAVDVLSSIRPLDSDYRMTKTTFFALLYEYPFDAKLGAHGIDKMQSTAYEEMMKIKDLNPTSFEKQRGNLSDVIDVKSPDTELTEEKEADDVFSIVEKFPTYPGGNTAMYKYLGGILMYPDDARSNGIQGRVIVSLVIEKDGSVTGVKVVKKGHQSLDAEAIRIVKSLYGFNPGTQRGRPVRTSFLIPITFRLL